MKKWGAVFLLLTLMGCERLPLNPDMAEPSGPTVTIRHETTEYITATPEVEGLAANKVNILTFSVHVDNEHLHSIEFIGVAMLNGPPTFCQHAIHYRTDSLTAMPKGMNVDFEQFNDLQPGETYRFKRALLPTNEYAPFEADQGRVEWIAITEIWGYDEEGTAHRLNPLSE